MHSHHVKYYLRRNFVLFRIACELANFAFATRPSIKSRTFDARIQNVMFSVLIFISKMTNLSSYFGRERVKPFAGGWTVPCRVLETESYGNSHFLGSRLSASGRGRNVFSFVFLFCNDCESTNECQRKIFCM